MSTVAAFDIQRDDLSDPRVATFLEEHLQDMRRVSPPESVHALDLDGLRQPEVAFWTLWHGDGDIRLLVGTGALKSLDTGHAEVKSMRLHTAWRGHGLVTRMLEHLMAHARTTGTQRLSLETGSQPFFAPARALYERHGFAPCPPFGHYREDPASCFYTRCL
ncbi:MAG: GNAT family N-acetyltransferase [Hydrogenophaga sp.]|nr:GNAT family N-acetyltransferase [Hydrogenophaga sp.]